MYTYYLIIDKDKDTIRASRPSYDAAIEVARHNSIATGGSYLVAEVVWGVDAHNPKHFDTTEYRYEEI